MLLRGVLEAKPHKNDEVYPPMAGNLRSPNIFCVYFVALNW